MHKLSLTVSGLQKTYGTTKIVEGFGIEVAAGAFVALLGPSGSGKTTILRCIAGLEKPDADSGPIRLGDVRLSEKREFLPPEKRGIGMVFQNYAVWPHLTVFENVAFPLRISKPRTEGVELQRRVKEALGLVRLDQYAERFPHQLSGGQQQRVALARALVARPKLLLLDEPLSNLDALLRDDLGGEIRRLQKELGLTAILVTHDRNEALALSDRLVILKNGKVAADGEPEALYAEPPNDFVAEFLAGGQVLTTGGRAYLPRRWRVLEAGSAAAGSGAGARIAAKIEARIFRGNEYEYFAATPAFAGSLRFFTEKKLEAGEAVELSYQD